MPPDVLSGKDDGAWRQEELALLYNHTSWRLPPGKRGRLSLRHRMPSFQLHTTCWILDLTIDLIIDVMINVEPTGTCMNVQTVLQVRHTLKAGNTPGSLGELSHQKFRRWLYCITSWNLAIHHAVSSPSAWNITGEIEVIRAQGTKARNGKLSTVPFATNDSVASLRNT
jgi:hypothetical protein